jgi:FKBP-type peptidyl-prolyl cis-trans isomerase FklB
MKKLIIAALVLVASASFSTTSAQDLKTSGDSISYAAGVSLTNGLDQFLHQQYGVTEDQKADVIRGFKDAVAKRKEKSFKAYNAGIQIAQMVNERMLPDLTKDMNSGNLAINEELVFEGFEAALRNDTTIFTEAKATKRFSDAREAIQEQKNATIKAQGEAFLAENKKKADVVTLPDGLQYKILVKGNGAIPKASDKVEVVYEGKTLDGNVFDATYKHDRPSDTFGVSGLIKGWTEALLMMPVGSKWELYIPYDLAYGSRGAGRDIAPYSTLIFTLELKGIVSDNASATPTAKKKVSATTKKAVPATRKAKTRK